MSVYDVIERQAEEKVRLRAKNERREAFARGFRLFAAVLFGGISIFFSFLLERYQWAFPTSLLCLFASMGFLVSYVHVRGMQKYEKRISEVPHDVDSLRF